MKLCTKCGETKPKTEFSKHSGKRDGLQSRCKACDRISSANWVAANTEKKRALDAAWHAANPVKREVKAAQYAAHREKHIATVKKWRKANPEAHRIINHNYRARKREAGGKLSKGLAEKLFKLQRGKCACGCNQLLGDNYHLDHIMPLALGGSNTDDNIQLLRAKCNNHKRAKHPIDFMQQQGFLL